MLTPLWRPRRYEAQEYLLVYAEHELFASLRTANCLDGSATQSQVASWNRPRKMCHGRKPDSNFSSFLGSSPRPNNYSYLMCHPPPPTYSHLNNHFISFKYEIKPKQTKTTPTWKSCFLRPAIIAAWFFLSCSGNSALSVQPGLLCGRASRSVA